MFERTSGRHVLRGTTRVFRPIRALLAASLTGVITIGAFTAVSGGTYALWNGSQATEPATVTSGTATLAVTSALSMPTTRMYPGLTIYGPATVGNTGDVPLSLRVTSLTGPTSSTTFSQALTVGVATASSAANCRNNVVTSSWSTGTFAAPPVATIGSPLPKSVGTTVVCVSLTLAPTVASGAQGQSATNFGIVINGIQA